MDYINMTDREFIKFVQKFNREKSVALFEILSKTPEFFDRIKQMKRDKVVNGDVSKDFTSLLNTYGSYTRLCSLKKIITTPKFFSDKSERVRVFSVIFNNSFSAQNLFGPEDKKMFKFLKTNYESCRNFTVYSDETKEPISEKEYMKIVSLVKRFITAFKKFSNEENYYVYLYDELKISNKDFSYYTNIVTMLYLRSLLHDDTFDTSDEFSYEDINLLNKINGNYNVFCNHNLSIILSEFRFEKLSKEENEKLLNILKILEDFLEKNDFNYYELVNYIVSELKITLGDFEKEYRNLLDKYRRVVVNREKTVYSTPDFKLKYVCILSNALEYYSNLVLKVKNLTEIICDNSKDRDRIIDISYNAKAFNDITPSQNRLKFNSKEVLYHTKEGRERISQYIENYKIYFQHVREIQKKEKENQKRLEEEYMFEQQKNEIDKYVAIVKAYIDSKENTLGDYFKNHNVDKNEFEEAVAILKKAEHPVFDEYTKHIERKRNLNFFTLLSSAKRVIKLIKNGVKESETKNEETREFNILDYYENTKLSTTDFLRVIKGRVTNEEYSIALRFLVRYKNDYILDAKQIHSLLSQKIAFATELDADHNPINEYEVTKEDKEQVIIILKERGIPITRKTYSLMLRTYVFTEILKIDPKKKVKKD